MGRDAPRLCENLPDQPPVTGTEPPPQVKPQEPDARIRRDPSSRIIELCQILDDPPHRQIPLATDASQIDYVHLRTLRVAAQEHVVQIEILVMQIFVMYPAGDFGDLSEQAPAIGLVR